MADRLNWAQGKPGKGLVLRNGDIHTWPTDFAGEPSHQVYWSERNVQHQPSFMFHVDPSGGLHDNEIGYSNKTGRPDEDVMNSIMAADTRHHVASPDENWELDEQAPEPGLPQGTDYNFVLRGSVEDEGEYATLLGEWLSDMDGFVEPQPISPHHDNAMDMLPRPSVSPSDAPPYYPPGHEPDVEKQSRASLTHCRECGSALNVSHGIESCANCGMAYDPEDEYPPSETTDGDWRAPWLSRLL